MNLIILNQEECYSNDVRTLIEDLKEKCEASRFLRKKVMKNIKVCKVNNDGERYCLVFAEYSNDIMAVYALSEKAYGTVGIVLAGKGRPFTIVVFSQEVKSFLEEKLKEKYGDSKVVIST